MRGAGTRWRRRRWGSVQHRHRYVACLNLMLCVATCILGVSILLPLTAQLVHGDDVMCIVVGAPLCVLPCATPSPCFDCTAGGRASSKCGEADSACAEAAAPCWHVAAVLPASWHRCWTVGSRGRATGQSRRGPHGSPRGRHTAWRRRSSSRRHAARRKHCSRRQCQQREPCC